MSSHSLRARVWLLAFAAIALAAFCFPIAAQVQTQTATTNGAPAREVSVERGEVVYVSGHDLMVKMEDGSLRNFENVPDSAKVMVDGNAMGIHDLKPGMKIERTITTITTPQVVTTTQTVTGKVWQVMPPKSVILKLEDGTTQKFTVPDGQKFTINGEEKDVWGLKQGMTVSATKVTEEPATIIEHQHQLTGTMPPAPPAPPADIPILIAVLTPHPALTPAQPPMPSAPKELPKTGSMLPLIGLLGALALASSLVLRAIKVR